MFLLCGASRQLVGFLRLDNHFLTMFILRTHSHYTETKQGFQRTFFTSIYLGLPLRRTFSFYSAHTVHSFGSRSFITSSRHVLIRFYFLLVFPVLYRHNVAVLLVSETVLLAALRAALQKRPLPMIEAPQEYHPTLGLSKSDFASDTAQPPQVLKTSSPIAVRWPGSSGRSPPRCPISAFSHILLLLVHAPKACPQTGGL